MQLRNVALCVVVVALAANCGTPGAPNTIQPDGLYRHSYIQLEFPERVGIFDRLYVTEYDPDAANVSGHYSGPRSLPSQATIYLYPATIDGAPPSRDEFIGHLEWAMSQVESATPGATLVDSGGYNAEINGFELNGAHARFTLPEHPTYSGEVDSHLYLFALDGWFLKFRFSHPERISGEVIPHEQAFIAATKWPIPEQNPPDGKPTTQQAIAAGVTTLQIYRSW